MAHAASGRNGHGTRAPRGLVLFLVASICIFAGGAGGLAWACEQARSVQATAHGARAWQAPAQEAPQADGQDTPAADDDAQGVGEGDGRGVISAAVDSDAGESAAQEAQKARSTAAARGNDSASEPDKASKERTGASKSSGAKSSGSASAPAAPTAKVKTKKVRHTAYKRTPVYRNEHHKAAVAKKVASADGYKVEWTLCPVCGKRHASSYTKKVVVRYKETLCKACGGKHKHAYTETVRQ